MIMGILTGLLKKAAAPILGGPFKICMGGRKDKNGNCMAHDTAPVISYISTHKIKPKVKHTTIA